MFIQFFSILLFRICILLSRIFFPTSYVCLVLKLHVCDLALSTIWKLSHINSLSQSSFLISLYRIIACRYMHTFSGKARFARLCISVCVKRWEFSLGMQVLQAFADANFILFFSFSGCYCTSKWPSHTIRWWFPICP